MRFTLPQPKRRRPKQGTASTRARTGRTAPPAAGGPVAPTTQYVGTRRRRSGSMKGGGSIFATKRSSPVSRRIVLTALICACLGLITASYRGGVALHSAQLVVLEVVAPIERGMTRAWDPIAGAWNWTSDLFGAASENDDLRDENAELRSRLVVAQEEAAAAAALRDELGIEQRGRYPDGYDRVRGRVINRVAGAVDRSITIDLGSNDGIERNDPVLVAGNLIGRVVATTPNTAKVGLILDNAQSVTAKVSNSDGWGVLQSLSSEGTPLMRLKYVSTGAKVDRFDPVLTAGWSSGDLESIYPQNIPIGYVSSVGNSPADLEQTVQVTPYANFERIEHVVVLVPVGERVSYENPTLDGNGLVDTGDSRRSGPAARVPKSVEQVGVEQPKRPAAKPSARPTTAATERASG